MALTMLGLYALLIPVFRGAFETFPTELFEKFLEEFERYDADTGHRPEGPNGRVGSPVEPDIKTEPRGHTDSE